MGTHRYEDRGTTLRLFTGMRDAMAAEDAREPLRYATGWIAKNSSGQWVDGCGVLPNDWRPLDTLTNPSAGARCDAAEALSPRVLNLTLKRQWFDMIASGVKREEYREMKPYWHKRLGGNSFYAVHFRNGYSADAPAMLVELRDISFGLGVLEWGAPPAQSVYILRLGAVLKAPNV